MAWRAVPQGRRFVLTSVLVGQGEYASILVEGSASVNQVAEPTVIRLRLRSRPEVSCVDLIPHSPGRKITHHRGGEEVVRKAHLDPIDRIQTFDECSVQRDADAGKIVFDLRQLASTVEIAQDSP